MRRYEMDVFEEMDAIIDDFFTSWEQVITYEEPEEDEEEDEEEEDEESSSWEWYTEKELIEANKYDDERGAWELWEQARAYSLSFFCL